MSGIMTKWVVLQEHGVEPADFDAGGVLRRESLERWIAAACSAYLDRCDQLQRRSDTSRLLRSCNAEQLDPARLGTPESVVVSASTTEVRPDSFTMAVRLRGTYDGAVNATCEVFLEDQATGLRCELGNEIRDELIALEHAARHFN